MIISPITFLMNLDFQEQLTNELNDYFKQLDQHVSVCEHDKLIVEFDQLTVKHREILHKQILIVCNFHVEN